ncbi:protein-glutamine gamma-glutamyltransferase [Halobacillus salinarum]|uniref:Protein-glutamine gamma-glutamyltransferase n=1 Tax=Halobacillus salinarum TaxID=2932257 RepID=A0ABY4ENB2_9BACI|nr:protein-glutamine gamma-glutamyltransferase [Halobacillus salinarum]UOQ45470.1 protein-glutamine gamma-glutamyltransferase [Halobacillus salinarum]
MIQVSGRPFQPSDSWKTNKVDSDIIEALQKSPNVYAYYSEQGLLFEIKARRNIVESAKAMDAGESVFATFKNARCNSEYWNLTEAGGFLLKRDAQPGNAVQDIFTNSDLYRFECATACVILLYDGLLQTIGSPSFNYLFPSIYLYSWYSDDDLGLHTFYSDHSIPGDVVYFMNPDVDASTPWFRGVNAIAMGNDHYFGHGFGIRTDDEIIEVLNEKRKAGSQQSAYLTSLITRPSFQQLGAYTAQGRSAQKTAPPLVHHNRNSISFMHYLYVLRIQFKI